MSEPYSIITERKQNRVKVILGNLGLEEDHLLKTLTLTKKLGRSDNYSIIWGKKTTYVLLKPIKFKSNIKDKYFTELECEKVLNELVRLNPDNTEYAISRGIQDLLELLYKQNLVRKIITETDETLWCCDG